jgi:hypothetical protein
MGYFLPMIEDIDVWRAANLLIKQHGADAELTAAKRVDDMIADGDPASEATWKRIQAACTRITAR